MDVLKQGRVEIRNFGRASPLTSSGAVFLGDILHLRLQVWDAFLRIGGFGCEIPVLRDGLWGLECVDEEWW